MHRGKRVMEGWVSLSLPFSRYAAKEISRQA